MKIAYPLTPENAIAHIEPAVWQTANRLHLQKAIAEFSHEGIIKPEKLKPAGSENTYRLITPDGTYTYCFTAVVRALHHWNIDLKSIEKFDFAGEKQPLDVLSFIGEFRSATGLSDTALPVYLEEIAGTLYASAYTFYHPKPDSAKLADAGYQQVEGSMKGHPRFIANNGRLGFDTADYQAYAPEAAKPFALLWLAGHKDQAIFTGINGLDYQRLLEQELDTETRIGFDDTLKQKGVSPADYFYFAIHPWQWFNKLLHLFAADIAYNKLICLGYGTDEYLPQQSIRTFYNVNDPKKFYVKTALGILNMGYVRGLSPAYMASNPGINEWIENVLNEDPYLVSTGFTLLKEVASVSYTHQYYEQASAKDGVYKKMLACLWREGPVNKLAPGQNLITMAAFLHTDNEGKALLPEIIRRSGLQAADWLGRYLHVYISPLLHCFYQYDMVFMPHGENLIMVMENHIPVRAIMKDIGEEVSLLNPDMEVPDIAQRLKVEVSEQCRTLPIFTQVFDSILRFIADLLISADSITEDEFWKTVARCVTAYQNSNPQHYEKFSRYDLFVPTIRPDALNRLQLNNNRQLRNKARPFDGLPDVGDLLNPIARFKQA